MKLFILIAIACLILIAFAIVVEGDEIDDLVPYIVQVESSGNPHAVSKAGCIGLMGISVIVLKEWDIEKSNFENSCAFYPPCKYCIKPKIDLCNPIDNKRVGTWYLHRLKNHYLKDDYTIERMLCAWNGGITRLRKANYDCSRMPKESQEFSRKVLKLYRRGIR